MSWFALFLVGLGLRLAFVAWAPGQISGDALFYALYAASLARGHGYVEVDGSPAILWMPGWPYLLSLVQGFFGSAPKAGMYANAVMGALTGPCLATAGRHLFDRRVGLAAGIFYAVWPGNIYYCATLFSEVSFNFSLALASSLFAMALSPERCRRHRWLFVAALVFFAASMIKAEAPIFFPVVFLWIWFSRRSPREFLVSAAVVLAALLLVRGPWVYRNYVLFDRFIFSTSSAGMNFFIGNHAGAKGGQDWLASVLNRERYPGATIAENNLNANAGGWRDGLEFVRAHPREELRILWRKLVNTYRTDDDGVLYVRGVGQGTDDFLDPATVALLQRVANGYWAAIAALALAGLAGVRRWSPAARAVVLLPILLSFPVHLVFLGEPRFHVPETLSLALMAGFAASRLVAR